MLGDSDTVGEEEMTVLHAHPLLKGGKGGKSKIHTTLKRGEDQSHHNIDIVYTLVSATM